MLLYQRLQVVYAFHRDGDAGATPGEQLHADKLRAAGRGAVQRLIDDEVGSSEKIIRKKISCCSSAHRRARRTVRTSAGSCRRCGASRELPPR